MKKTYLFYDIETSGLNKAFDQVLQFAAIRTDTDLNEIERHEVDIRLSPDVIPSPGAVLTHQITPAATAKGVPEIEAISEIHRLFNQPGTISGGYNTLGFDDEFLRFSFYRNLLPPYTHQYENGCSRFYIFTLIPLY
jgi:exodeoxyribonuclease-1